MLKTAVSITAQLILAAVCVAPALSAAVTPSVPVGLSSNAPTVDGKIAAAEWRDAATITNFVANRGQALPAKDQTEIYIKRDSQALYIALRCVQTDGRIRAVAERDADLFTGDAIEIFVQPDLGSDMRYQIIVNPAGAVYDSRLPSPGVGWNGSLAYEASISRGRWEGELAVPFAELGMRPPSDGQAIGFFVARDQACPTALASSWTQLASLHDSSGWGRIVFSSTAPIVRLDTLNDASKGISGTLLNTDRGMNVQTVSVSLIVTANGNQVMSKRQDVSIPPRAAAHFEIPYDSNYGAHSADVTVTEHGNAIFAQRICANQRQRMSIRRFIGSQNVEVALDTSSLTINDKASLRVDVMDGDKTLLTKTGQVRRGTRECVVWIDTSALAPGNYRVFATIGLQRIEDCVFSNAKDQSWFGLTRVEGALLQIGPGGLPDVSYALSDKEPASYKIEAAFAIGDYAGTPRVVMRGHGGTVAETYFASHGAIGEFRGLARFPGKNSVYMNDTTSYENLGWVGEHTLKVLVGNNLANVYLDGVLVNILDLSGLSPGEYGLGARGSVTFTRATFSPLGKNDKLVSARPVRSLLRNGKVYKAQLDWHTAINNAAKAIDSAIADGTKDVPGMETMPNYTYRCIWDMTELGRFYSYPAFHHSVIVNGLINLAEYRNDRKYVSEALRLAKWNISHSTPATAKLPHLPYSSTCNGQMGGNVDGDTVMLDKAGRMGQTYIRLYRMTHEPDFREAAILIGETLLKAQLPDGRWQNRVEFRTGKVIQDYMSNQAFIIQFMDDLYETTRDTRYKDASARSLGWTLANPVKTGRWVGFYEDVGSDVESIGNHEAIKFARYLLAHRKGNPRYLKIASELTDWVATSFAISDRGRYSQVVEQTVCAYPMSAHTLNYCMLLMDMYDATGNAYYRNATESCFNAATDIYGGGMDTASGWYSIDAEMLSSGLDTAKRLGLR